MKKEAEGKKRESQKTERPGEAEAREGDERRKHIQGENQWTGGLFMLISVLKQKDIVNSRSTACKKSSDQLK